MTHIIKPTGKWTQFMSSSHLSGKYGLTKIEDDLSVLNIFLTHHTGVQFIKLSFNSTWAYRNTNETLRMGIVDELDKRYGTEFYVNWSFFKIENSAYLDWLSQQSYGYAKDFKIQHFVIMGMHYIVDVAANNDPEITFLDKSPVVFVD